MGSRSVESLQGIGRQGVAESELSSEEFANPTPAEVPGGIYRRGSAPTPPQTCELRSRNYSYDFVLVT
jgi:hypothetical protein